MIQEFRCTILRLTGGHSDSSASTLHRLTFSRNFIKLISASTIPQAPRSRLHSASATGGAAEVRHCFWRFGSKRLPFSISIGHASPDRAGARLYHLQWGITFLSRATPAQTQERVRERVPTVRPSTSHLSPLTILAPLARISAARNGHRRNDYRLGPAER
jgi:hypothetical protein